MNIASLTAVALLLSGLLVGGCIRGADKATEDELPTLSFTRWSERTEVFAEHPPLVAGRDARFAVHLTELRTFKPLPAGRALIEFDRGGARTVLTGDPPSRPGLFRVEGKPPAAGQYTWALIVEAPGISDRHPLGTVTVYPDEASARVAAGSKAARTVVTYLKEQQWTNEFATAVVVERDVRAAIRAPATVRPTPGGEAVVPAPANGRFAGTVPAMGDRVSAGEVLGRFEPRLQTLEDRATLASDVASKRAEVAAAEREKTRAERLLAERAVPQRRLEEATLALDIARAELLASESRLAQREQTLARGGSAAGGNAFALRAPVTGTIVRVGATPGASYEEGAELFRIVRTDPVLIEVQVPAAEAARVAQITGAALQLPGIEEPVELTLRRVRHAGVVDTSTRAVPVWLEVPNPGRRLVVGQTATAVLYTPDRRRFPVVPSDAILTESGRPVVFVQVEGEAFERRLIRLGPRDAGLVGILSGVKPGDRVVTRGAYEVLLASAAKGLPAEGHVH